ncbi:MULTISPECIES: type II toxin-antitoxin system RelB/DinJ family antitoxin [Yersiniaceae]|uniref:type II toxin-antitoxin system RelB/DinJ family antitoxin n=1 Tax=Yersiniaceae TaxID=1903411 RepID=UPI0005DEC726|nr:MULTISPECIES: type II toxin-antitoxin system RelB/DinJ family antitoxin [Yersiniaceae]CAI2478093.1 Antitoxin DinJ [Serratia liquefaciens]CNI50949.1 DinJ-like protein [Yersinia intermedia]CQH53304.1 DinJ-like protein [Yersinia frederiksenii]
MASIDVVRARINVVIKEEVTHVLAEMGLSFSDALRILLTQMAADKSLPFDVNRGSPLWVGKRRQRHPSKQLISNGP